MSDTDKQYRYAWDWFDYHAKQRLITFNFFLIIMGALGYVYIFGDKNIINPLIIPLAFFGAIISFLFLLLEVRNTILVDDGRAGLDKLEKDNYFNKMLIRKSDLKRFYLDKKSVDNPGNSVWRRTGFVLSSHTFCLRFVLSASIGMCLFIAFNSMNLLRECFCVIALIVALLLIFVFSTWQKIWSVIFNPKELNSK